MVMEERKNLKSKVHNVLIENRERITINGVDDVESFDENNIILVVNDELLVIKGFDLRINQDKYRHRRGVHRRADLFP